MTSQEALKVAVRVVTKEYREVKRNVMADPRAAELRGLKLSELEDALATLQRATFLAVLSADKTQLSAL